MDYWCALWFWPITESASLPSRDQWWLEIGAILEGSVIDMSMQRELAIDFTGEKSSGPQAGLFEANDTQPKLHDRFGQLRISKLKQTFQNIKTVENSASRHRFFHWELSFADIFSLGGGFDLVLGNPPWLKVLWNEAGILGEVNPKVSIRKLNATELSQTRVDAFKLFFNLKAEWTFELEEAEATQSYLNATQNYPVLKGIQTNLYKCFIPLGWMLVGRTGVIGYLHPEGPFDDPRGGLFREFIYSRLRAHFQFINEIKLFSDVGNQAKFSINIYGDRKSQIEFFHISNLFSPKTITESFSHEGFGVADGYKSSDGKWNIKGHLDRIVVIDIGKLSTFAGLYDDPGTSPERARLPAVHAGALSSVLDKLYKCETKFLKLKNSYYSSPMFHETYAKNEGVIIRNEDRTTSFPISPDGLIISGPHFFVGNPLNQTPRRICDTHRAYEILDLTELADNFLPRTNFRPAEDIQKYNANIPLVKFGGHPELPFLNFYRLAFRNMIAAPLERTLISCIIPPGVAHPNSVSSVCFDDLNKLLSLAVVSVSVSADFFVKASGRTGLYDTWTLLPYIELLPEMVVRILGLNCITIHYSKLWEQSYNNLFTHDSWSQSDNKRLPQDWFNNLSLKWNNHVPLRTEYSRRMALIELDVLVGQSIGLTLDELRLIYRIQFPVMQQYERDTWYDINGRIVFTNSKGLVGVGLPRKRKRNDPEIKLTLPDGATLEVEGWDAIRKLQDDGKLPEGSVVSTWVMDDTQPGGPTRRERKYVVPFAVANREEDYRIAWEFFEKKKAAEKKS